MDISRRNFLGGLAAGTVLATAPGCATKCCKACRPGKIALQLYSIRDYIAKVGLEIALEDVAKIGYEGVEFAGYWDKSAKELKKILDDNGLVACGTHVGREEFGPDKIKETCEFNLEFGNRFLCCPGGGNFPPGCDWGKLESNDQTDGFVKMLCEFYNQAAVDARGYGCLVGLHNHMWEFQLRINNGSITFWDYFFSNTDPAVQMEQDVGWTTCAGFDPCEQYRKYPHRSFTLHAKENGMGDGITKFDAILGQPGQTDDPSKPGAAGVDWDRLFPVTDKDGVQWYVVECERHSDDLSAVAPSFEFLKSKGRI
ncbi:MAG: TIM barrel protein [Kiritimatiellae bacterium]|nr:TIM barrel protein [Kiritimatiellia bacterium]